MKFFFLRQLCISSAIRPCMEYCCPIQAGAPNYYLEILDKLQKRICRTVGPSLLPLLNPWLVVEMYILIVYKYYFRRCLSELAQLVPLPYSRVRSACYSERLHDFSVTIPRCHKDVYADSFFFHIVRLWNSLPGECFPLTYNLNGVISSIGRHLLYVGYL